MQLILFISSGIAGATFDLQIRSNARLKALYKPILVDSIPHLLNLSFPHNPDPSPSKADPPSFESALEFGAGIAFTAQATWPLSRLGLGPELSGISQRIDDIKIYGTPWFWPRGMARKKGVYVNRMIGPGADDEERGSGDRFGAGAASRGLLISPKVWKKEERVFFSKKLVRVVGT